MASEAISPPPEVEIKLESKATLTPPASEHTDKHDDSGSELSDLEPEADTHDEIFPDHYYGGGKIPVFKPVCLLHQDAISIATTHWHSLPHALSSIKLTYSTDNGPVSQLQIIHLKNR